MCKIITPTPAQQQMADALLLLVEGVSVCASV